MNEEEFHCEDCEYFYPGHDVFAVCGHCDFYDVPAHASDEICEKFVGKDE